MFHPDKYTDLKKLYTLPDYDKVHSELKRVGVPFTFVFQSFQAFSQIRSRKRKNFPKNKFSSSQNGFGNFS